MKIQLCRFKRGEKSNYELGVAFLDDFNVSDVNKIIPIESSKKIVSIWTYTLIDGPLKHIDTEYL